MDVEKDHCICNCHRSNRQASCRIIKERWVDEIFFLDLPNLEEIKYSRFAFKKEDQVTVFLSTIIDRTNGFSRTELEQAVIEGCTFHSQKIESLWKRFKRQFLNWFLIQNNKEQIDLLKEWSSSGSPLCILINLNFSKC